MQSLKSCRGIEVYDRDSNTATHTLIIITLLLLLLLLPLFMHPSLQAQTRRPFTSRSRRNSTIAGGGV
jgi:hypothetical protein